MASFDCKKNVRLLDVSASRASTVVTLFKDVCVGYITEFFFTLRTEVLAILPEIIFHISFFLSGWPIKQSKE